MYEINRTTQLEIAGGNGFADRAQACLNGMSAFGIMAAYAGGATAGAGLLPVLAAGCVTGLLSFELTK